MPRVSLFRPFRRGVLSTEAAQPQRAGGRHVGAHCQRDPGRHALVEANDSNGPGNGGDRAGWAFLCVVEIGNFAELRRHFGTAAAADLIAVVQSHLLAVLPDARPVPAGRASLEFRFDSTLREDVDSALASLADRFTAPVPVGDGLRRIDVVLAGAAVPLDCLDDVGLAEAIEEAAATARREQRIVIFDLSAGEDALDRPGLVRDLAGAIARGEMCLHYQPKLHVRRQKITGLEALVRWRHPQRGLILPGNFIPAAEEAQIITELTLWTLDQVVADQKRLAAAGHDLEIFVNISGQLLSDSAFVAEACDRVRSTEGRIGFEITETSVIRNPETAITHLREIAAIGVPIAIDDYGAGLSSLAYLKQLPACELKIDKMFVLQLTSSNRDPLIVRSTIDLAHAMEMEVTAEGVETQAALALLSVMGCDMIQGFLIGRPMPIEQLGDYLAEEPMVAHPSPAGSAFNQPASFWNRG